MKIKWKVSEKPTGQYRSFIKRQWPMAYYEDGKPCASISCEDSYHPSDAREGHHRPLTLLVADHSVTPWQWRKVKRTFDRLEDAKAAVKRVLVDHPTMAPGVKMEILTGP